MPRSTTVLRVFVASPSDVSEERSLFDSVVAKLNQTWSSTIGVLLEVVKWETNVRPAFSTDPQSVINDQIGLDYDVFVGVFWGRIGTPTPRASSGSLEEFERAYKRWLSTKEPEIMLYFKETPISPSKIDIDQLRGVQDFRNSLSDKGGLFSTFEDQAGFESSLRSHLSAVAQKFAAHSSKRINAPANAAPPPAIEVIHDEEQDYGYLDYLEIFESKQADMTAALNLVNEATVRVGEQMSQRAGEIQKMQPADPRTAQRFVRRTADDMNSYSNIMEMQISAIAAARVEAYNALSNALALRGDFQTDQAELISLKETLSRMLESAGSARIGMGGMRQSTQSLPRLNKELNKAKRAVVHQLDALLAEIDSTTSTVGNIIESIDKMLTSSD